MKINADEDDFLFFSKNEIEEKNHIYEISKIITKYNILKDENELIGPKRKKSSSYYKLCIKFTKTRNKITNRFTKSIFKQYNTKKRYKSLS